eukprot:3085804-Pleurochrysis_carterae.AAC.3
MRAFARPQTCAAWRAEMQAPNEMRPRRKREQQRERSNNRRNRAPGVRRKDPLRQGALAALDPVRVARSVRVLSDASAVALRPRFLMRRRENFSIWLLSRVNVYYFTWYDFRRA